MGLGAGLLARASNRPRLVFLPGAVAQLGERLICIQEVAGSIPTSSTKLSCSGPEDLANAAIGLRRWSRRAVYQPGATSAWKGL